MPTTYDIMHFEALGAEAQHLVEETERAKAAGLLPADLRYVVTPLNLQEYLAEHPETVLPDILTTKTHSVPPEDYLSSSRKSIITRSTGYDHYEGIQSRANIASLRRYCVGSVAQTAIKFMYAAAGLLNQYTANTADFERNRNESFMELCKDRTATVFGVGNIGRQIYDLAEANGLRVQAVDVRQEALQAQYGPGAVHFVSPEEAVETSDILFCGMNLTRDPASPYCNVGYFSEGLLRKAKKGVLFINVTRGEIAPESVLLKLYREGQIGGIGLDVFSEESALSDALRGHAGRTDADIEAARELIRMAEDRSANVYVQPHQAFNSDRAAADKAHDTIEHVIYWYQHGKKGFAEQLPYY